MNKSETKNHCILGLPRLPCGMFTPWNGRLIPLWWSLFLRGRFGKSYRGGSITQTNNQPLCGLRKMDK